MENNSASTVSNSTNEAKPKNRKALLIAVTTMAIVGLVVSAFLFSGLRSAPNSNQDSWLFKGAYAKYEGSTSVLGLGFSFSIKLEVLDINSTHAYMSTSFKMGSSIGETAEEDNATWVELSKVGFMNAFSESNTTNSYDTTLDFGSLGTRTCTVYEISTDGPTLSVYVDKEIGWPLKMKASMTGEGTMSLSLDINLIETNIPELK